MIGVFDSGVGGLASVSYIKEALPDIDLAYIADTENSPFGTKSHGEIVKITEYNIERLRQMGAERVLIACCTASTAHPYISEGAAKISIPIIEPTARRAAFAAEGGKIGVIATERTVKSSAFPTAIKRYCPIAEVCQYPAQELVEYIENREASAVHEFISKTAEKITKDGCTTLILGCTHFSHARVVFSRHLPTVNVIDSAHAGALEVIRYAKNTSSRR